MSRRSRLSVVLSLLMLGSASADEIATALAPFENRPVTAIVLLGREVTREYVITRELETRVGESLHAAVVAQDRSRRCRSSSARSSRRPSTCSAIARS